LVYCTDHDRTGEAGGDFDPAVVQPFQQPVAVGENTGVVGVAEESHLEPPHGLERQAGDADIPDIASESGETAPDGAEEEDAVEPEASVAPVVAKSGAARKNPAKSSKARQPETDEQLGFGINLQS
jgi:hypothetical protein